MPIEDTCQRICLNIQGPYSSRAAIGGETPALCATSTLKVPRPVKRESIHGRCFAHSSTPAKVEPGAPPKWPITQATSWQSAVRPAAAASPRSCCSALAARVNAGPEEEPPAPVSESLPAAVTAWGCDWFASAAGLGAAASDRHRKPGRMATSAAATETAGCLASCGPGRDTRGMASACLTKQSQRMLGVLTPGPATSKRAACLRSSAPHRPTLAHPRSLGASMLIANPAEQGIAQATMPGSRSR